MQTITLTGDWQQISTAAESVIVQGTNNGSIYIGSTAPSASDKGFTIKWNVHNEFNLSAYGGNAWVRGNGALTYVNSA